MTGEEEKLVVAVCTVTGSQGKAIVQQAASATKLLIRGLTRDASSPKAQELTQKYPSSVLSLTEVDYSSSKSVRNALKGATALFLNCSIGMTQDKTYERIIDCAIQVGIKHIVHSSVLQLPQQQSTEDTIPPHWTSARHAEGYLAIRQDETKVAFHYHVLRLAPHLNETLLEKHPPNATPSSGAVSWIAYPWQPSIRVPTVSAKDVARVALQLFVNPDSLPNGAVVNVATDYCNPHEMAQHITLVTQNHQVQACKGPARLLLAPSLLSYENQCLVAMGAYLEEHTAKYGIVKDDWGKKQAKNKYQIADILKDDDASVETLQMFVQRIYGKSTA